MDSCLYKLQYIISYKYYFYPRVVYLKKL